MDRRKLEIDTLRGLACLLLVSYHVVGFNPDTGLRIAEGFYREVNDILAYLRMPLFTFLSGVVYAYRPFQTGAKRFISKKARRLLLPMLTVGTLFALTQAMVPGTNAGIENWYLLHIKPVAHFWFIESLFILFLLITLLETFKLLDTFPRFLGVFAATTVFFLLPITTNYFSISGFLFLTPYFLLGMGMFRYGKVQNQTLGWVLLLPVLAVFLLTYQGMLDIQGRRTLFALMVGVTACSALYLLGLRSRALAWIGVFSYSIYLFHVFFTAATRIGLNKFGITQLETVYILSMICGTLGPIITEKLLSKNPILGTAFLGKTFKKKT